MWYRCEMKTALLSIGLLAGLGCGRDNPPRQNAAPTAVAPAPAAPAPEKPRAGVIAGVVRETVDASTYTYALLEQDGRKIWVAGPKTQLAVGDRVGPVEGMVMHDFHSDTLNRTFDQIYFLSSFGGAGTSSHASAPVVAPAVEKVAPAKGGTTVAAIFANKATLAGQAVVVRGKVTKVNTGILDRNWVHLADGTGSAGTNDLMVTTSATAAVGDVVVVRGKVAVDQDFGGGYRYPVLVEQATLTTE